MLQALVIAATKRRLDNQFQNKIANNPEGFWGFSMRFQGARLAHACTSRFELQGGQVARSDAGYGVLQS